MSQQAAVSKKMAASREMQEASEAAPLEMEKVEFSSVVTDQETNGKPASLVEEINDCIKDLSEDNDGSPVDPVENAVAETAEVADAAADKPETENISLNETEVTGFCVVLAIALFQEVDNPFFRGLVVASFAGGCLYRSLSKKNK